MYDVKQICFCFNLVRVNNISLYFFYIYIFFNVFKLNDPILKFMFISSDVPDVYK